MRVNLKDININQSFLASFIIHIVLLLIFSIFLLQQNLFIAPEPMLVTIESPVDSIASSLNSMLDAPTHAQAPTLEERVSPVVQKNAVPDKAVPEMPAINPKQNSQSEVKETIKNNLTVKDSEDLFKIDPNKIKNNQNQKEMDQLAKKNSTPADTLDKIFEEPAKDNQPSTKPVNQIGELSQKIISELSNQQNVTGQPGKENQTVSQGEKLDKNDPLSDAKWTGQPRKTVKFPDLASKIPDEYKMKGLNYKITVRLTITPEGNVKKVNILESSGEIELDSIFQIELQNIIVESVPASVGPVTVVKTFTIKVK
jgi:outer membrane biosynthesis protein TonB